MFVPSQSQKPSSIYLAFAIALALFAPSAALGDCVTPAAPVGSLDFQGVFKYCDGTNWLNLSSSSFPIQGPDGSAAAPTYSFSAGTNTGMYSTGIGTLAFASAGAQRLTIDSSGNVGIGTTLPAAKLEVNGTAGIRTNHVGVKDYTNDDSTVNFTSQISGLDSNDSQSWALGDHDPTAKTVRLYAASGHEVSIWASNLERLRISTSGNVAIGTTAALTGTRLYATGGAIAAGSIGSGSGNAGQIRFYDLGTSGNNFVAFRAPDSLAADVVWSLPPADGSANQVLSTNGAGSLAWATAGGGALTNLTESVNSAAPNATIPVVRLLATNGATNVDIALSPKGTGAVTAQVADSATAGGNKRGQSAVDWQSVRSAASQVANGRWTTISGGADNTASADYAAVAGGINNLASGNYSFSGGGLTNTASGGYSATLGGTANTASGTGATSTGSNNTSSGYYSLTANINTTAEAYAQTVFGQYNILTGGSSGSWIPTETLFAIGNGSTSGSRSNAMTVLKNGNVGIGTTNPDSKLSVSGAVHATGQLTSAQNVVASGATVDFDTGNVQILQAPGAAAITLNNMKDGGSYSILITDTTSRTYTFTNCTNSKYVPANSASETGTQTLYTIVKVTISAATYCYISWITGF